MIRYALVCERGHDFESWFQDSAAYDKQVKRELVTCDPDYAAKIGLANPAACAMAFRQVQERLIVMTRGAFTDQAASAIAATRRVPVLVVEPSGMAAGETGPAAAH